MKIDVNKKSKADEMKLYGDELYEIAREISKYFHTRLSDFIKKKIKDPNDIYAIMMTVLVEVASDNITNMCLCVNRSYNKPFPLPKEIIDRIMPTLIDSLKGAIRFKLEDEITQQHYKEGWKE